MKPHWREIVDRLRSWLILQAAFLAFLNFASIAQAQQTTLRIGGTGITLGTMRVIARTFEKANPGITVTVLSSLGSGGGIKAVLADGIDIALSARPPTEAELIRGAVAVEYAQAPLVFAISRTNSVTGITLVQLIDIYAGRLTEWPNGIPIRVILRPAGDIITTLLKSISRQMRDAVTAAEKRPGMVYALTDQDTIEHLARVPGSIGPTALNQILTDASRLKVLTLDGIVPSAAAIADSSYRYVFAYYLVTGQKASPLADRFIAFVQSETGRKILADTGHWPSGTTASR